MSVKSKALYYLKSVPIASKYQIRCAVNSWQDRRYDEQSIDRFLQRSEGTLLTQEKVDGIIYFRLKDCAL